MSTEYSDGYPTVSPQDWDCRLVKAELNLSYTGYSKSGMVILNSGMSPLQQAKTHKTWNEKKIKNKKKTMSTCKILFNSSILLFGGFYNFLKSTIFFSKKNIEIYTMISPKIN